MSKQAEATHAIKTLAASGRANIQYEVEGRDKATFVVVVEGNAYKFLIESDYCIWDARDLVDFPFTVIEADDTYYSGEDFFVPQIAPNGHLV